MPTPRHAVIIGAFGGIGSACVERLEREGYRVSKLSRNPFPDGIRCDVTDDASVKSAIGYAAADGLDVLVCAWGHPPMIAPSLSLDTESFSGVIATDLVGAFRVAKQAGKYMCSAGHGRIVFVSSIHALATYPERAAYAAAKAGVLGMARSLAIEWGRRGVTVNCVLPGQVDSPRSDSLSLPLEKILARSPTGKIPTCADVADAVAFLCKKESGHINGAALVIDGGWTIDAYWDHGRA